MAELSNHRKIGIMAGALLLCAPLAPPAGSQEAVAAAGETTSERELFVPYSYYQFNYPHEIPSDYVFRTARIFSPEELRAARAKSEAAGSALPFRDPGFDERLISALVTELVSGRAHNLRGEGALMVSTPVNLGNLYATSSFGRLLGERLLGELQRAGVEVVDVRKTSAMLIHEQGGEFALSRNMDELSFVQNARAVLVGTYTATAERVVVELRVLRNQDGRVLASTRRDFDMTPEIAALLADESAPPRPPTPVQLRAFGR